MPIRPTIIHGTPMSPRPALEAVMPGRAGCVSFYRPDDVLPIERLCPVVMYDNGAFSFWQAALRAGREADETHRDWTPYYRWLEARQLGKRWAVIPDAIGAPSQINDGLINEWPHGQFGAPVWHMDGPLSRLERLCERWDRVCLGWVHADANERKVGSDSFRRRMDEVAAMFGNRWHPSLHMMRGVAVAFDYPFCQRRQHIARAKRPPVRQPYRHPARRSVARTAGLCRQIGGQAS